MKETITSLQNPRIKKVTLLSEKSSERRKQDLIVVEGKREIRLAMENKFPVDSVFICEELFDGKIFSLENLPPTQIFYVSKPVYDKMAFRENADGIIALLRPKYHDLENLHLKANPLLIILESVEKPGNLGAILRTADAAGVDAVIICDPKTDIYNPNSIRSSIGCVFTNQIATGSSEEVLSWLKNKKIICYAAALTANTFYHMKNFKQPTAFVMGTEAVGLTDFWLNKCDEQIKIPMLGKIDSLNVSTSTAILTFEAVRQRGIPEGH